MTRAGSFNGLGVVSGEEITRFVCMDFWAPYSLFLLIRMSSFLLVREGHFHLRKQGYLPRYPEMLYLESGNCKHIRLLFGCCFLLIVKTS